MSYLKQYEYVMAVVRNGGISQAAEELKISQPTFSKYLKKLETDLGLELFDRSTLPIRLTKAGKCFVEAGARFLDLDRQLKKQLDELRAEIGSTVRVGISPSRSPYTMPAVLSLFRERCPGARVVIVEETTAELGKMLTEGELDLLISLDGEGMREFERIELFSEEVLLAVPEGCAAESAEEAIRSSTLISVGRGQAMWRILRSISEELGAPTAEIECQSIESALALVKRGLGAMIVPSYITRETSGAVRYLHFPSHIAREYSRSVCIFYRKEQFLSGAEREFINCIIKSEKEN